MKKEFRQVIRMQWSAKPPVPVGLVPKMETTSGRQAPLTLSKIIVELFQAAGVAVLDFWDPNWLGEGGLAMNHSKAVLEAVKLALSGQNVFRDLRIGASLEPLLCQPHVHFSAVSGRNFTNSAMDLVALLCLKLQLRGNSLGSPDFMGYVDQVRGGSHDSLWQDCSYYQYLKAESRLLSSLPKPNRIGTMQSKA